MSNDAPADDRLRQPPHRFDERGAYLAEIQVGFRGPPFDRERLESHGIAFRFLRARRSVERWKTEITLLPEAPAGGCWFASIDAWTYGPGHDESVWDMRLAVAPDDDPPEDMRAGAFRGTFPHNLPELTKLAGVIGDIELLVNAKYVMRRARIPQATEALAPWLASTDPSERLRWSGWDVTGAPGLRQVAVNGLQGTDDVRTSAHVTLHAPISPAIIDVVDREAWPRLWSFLSARDPGVVAVAASDELWH